MPEFKNFKVTVKMKKPWVDLDSWLQKPGRDEVMERFREELQSGNIEQLFEVTVKEARAKRRCKP